MQLDLSLDDHLVFDNLQGNLTTMQYKSFYEFELGVMNKSDLELLYHWSLPLIPLHSGHGPPQSIKVSP